MFDTTAVLDRGSLTEKSEQNTFTREAQTL